MEVFTTKSCNLKWFDNRQSQAVFDELGYSAVYAVGPAQSDKSKISWGSQLPTRLVQIQNAHWQPLTLKTAMWTAGHIFAERLMRLVSELIDCRRIRGDWFDIPTGLLENAIRIAAGKANISLKTHEEMLASVVAERERRINRLIY